MLALNFLKVILIIFAGLFIITLMGNQHSNFVAFLDVTTVKNMLLQSWQLFTHLLIPILTIYIICSIPSGLICQKIFGTVDPRSIGSGNIGATNMLRTGNRMAAVFTLLGDFFKGYVCCHLFHLTFNGITGSIFNQQISIITPLSDIFTTLFLLLPVVAHVFPVWLNFKGGKGIATAFGVLLAFDPYIGMLSALTWIIVFLLSKISSLSGLIFCVLTPVISYFIVGANFSYWTIGLSLIILYTHRSNILNLINGDENSFKRA